MAKLARVFDLGWNIGQLFDHVFSHSAGVQRGAAPGEDDAPDIAQLARRHVQAAELGRAFFIVEPAAHRVAHRVGLLKDLLEHVVRVIAFLDVFGREFNFAHRVLAGCAIERTDFEFVTLDRDDVEIVQVNCVPRVGDNRTDITGQKIFMLAHAEHERTAAARTDDEVGNIGMNESDSICANDLL